jgi:hypothetical protein
MGYFEKITQENLCQLIEATENELYLCLPSIHEEIKNSILKLKDQKGQVQVHLLIDFDPQTLRQGYGEFYAISKLFPKVKIKELPNNRISFIISDKAGFFLFIESRSIVPANIQTLNAINIDPISQVRIKQLFFPSETKDEIENEIADAIIEETQLIEKAKEDLLTEKSLVPLEITLERYEFVKKNIEENPPLKPDFKRIVEYYSNKYQYAELSYHGQNIQHTAISIPPKILPYKNEEIKKKLKTKFKLFENIDESEFFKQFKEIEINKKEISESFLTPIRCRPNKSVLKKTEKIQFLKEIENLKDKLEKNKKNLYSAMLEEIKKSKHFLKENLFDFLMDNPTDDMKKMGVQNYQVIADNISNTLVDKLPIPDPIKIINNFNVKVIFSDLTYEDLRDNELINELTEKKILEGDEIWPLADFGKGVIIN